MQRSHPRGTVEPDYKVLLVVGGSIDPERGEVRAES